MRSAKPLCICACFIFCSCCCWWRCWRSSLRFSRINAFVVSSFNSSQPGWAFSSSVQSSNSAVCTTGMLAALVACNREKFCFELSAVVVGISTLVCFTMVGVIFCWTKGKTWVSFTVRGRQNGQSYLEEIDGWLLWRSLRLCQLLAILFDVLVYCSRRIVPRIPIAFGLRNNWSGYIGSSSRFTQQVALDGQRILTSLRCFVELWLPSFRTTLMLFKISHSELERFRRREKQHIARRTSAKMPSRNDLSRPKTWATSILRKEKICFDMPTETVTS